MKPEKGYSLGLDIGVGSCGWAVVDLDPKQPKIIKCGVRCFDLPETPKEGTPLNAIRRQMRGQRRVIRARRWRMEQLRTLLERFDLRADPPGATDPWELRATGLERLLNGPEWAAVLIHLAKHRGFLSNSKRDTGNDAPDENKKVLGGITRMRERAQAWRSVGQMLARDPAFAGQKRNRGYGHYEHSLGRNEIRDEAHLLFREQRRFGNASAIEALEEAYLPLAFEQRPLQSALHLVGPCRFEAGEKRASRNAPSFERFRYASTLSHLRIQLAGKERPLDANERRAALALFGMKQAKITYKTLRSKLDLDRDARFTGLTYGRTDKKTGKDINPEDKTVGDGTGTIALRTALGEDGWSALAVREGALDAVAALVVFEEGLDLIRQGLDSLSLPHESRDRLMEAASAGAFNALKGAGHLSAKAARALIPFLENGMNYSDACTEAGYDFRDQGETAIAEIRNPTVQRILMESRAQIQAIVEEFRSEYGPPAQIHLEMARDVGHSREKRNEISRKIEDRALERQKLRDDYAEKMGHAPTGDDLLKFELWMQQNHACIYSGEYIRPELLASGSNEIQVDHILPLSRSMDDGQANKVLCFTKANQDKKNRTPYEWRGESDPDWWHAFAVRVGGMALAGLKKRKLLDTAFAAREQEHSKRHLNDTRYAMRVLRQDLQNSFDLEPNVSLFTHAGQITARCRRAWGLAETKHRDGEHTGDDRNHAVDAVIGAFMTPDMVQQITKELQGEELLGRPASLRRIKPPGENRETFRQAVLAKLEEITVSRKSSQRARGELHGATLHGIAPDPQGSFAGPDGPLAVFERKAVTSLKRADLQRLKTDPANPDRIEPLRRALGDWLDRAEAQKLKLEKLYETDPPRMPTRDGSPGPAIRSVRLLATAKSGFLIQRGDAQVHVDNGGMVRVDVFEKGGKFFLVPVYLHQVRDRTAFPDPPTAIAPFRNEMSVDDNYRFRFSLFPNSYIELVKKDGSVVEGYYRKMDVASGTMTLSPHHRRRIEDMIRGIGVQNMASFRKYHIDRLGEKSEIVQEPRLWHGADFT